MSATRAYLDYNATAPLRASAREAMLAALSQPGNASSVHSEGRQAKAAIEAARMNAGRIVGAPADHVYFVSGATEAANTLLSPLFKFGKGGMAFEQLYVSAVEHPCVLAGGRFREDQLRLIAVDSNGLVDLPKLKAQLNAPGTMAPFIVSVMLANNETGVIQPIAEIAEIVHEAFGYLVVDAVQAVGRIPLSLDALGADFLFFSSHKIGGPQGAGALVVRDKGFIPMPLLTGGGQENYARGGTENVAAISGFGAACAELLEENDEIDRISAIRDSIEEALVPISMEAGNNCGMPEIFGRNVPRIGNTSCFAVPGIKAETAVISLDLAGIAVSSGSACSSGKVKASHVLSAMDVERELSDGALRISLGWDTSDQDAENFLTEWGKIVQRLG